MSRKPPIRRRQRAPDRGGYLQFALRADGNFDYAGVKLRSKLVHSPTTDNPFGVGINLEISRLPDSYDRDRWAAEIRPIGTATVGGDRLFLSANPIVDLGLAGPAASGAPSFEPAATALYVVGGLCSLGLEYYANLGPIGSWLPANQQEHYLYEVANVLRWRRWEINLGVRRRPHRWIQSPRRKDNRGVQVTAAFVAPVVVKNASDVRKDLGRRRGRGCDRSTEPSGLRSRRLGLVGRTLSLS
jgi:hypothetical protein